MSNSKIGFIIDKEYLNDFQEELPTMEKEEAVQKLKDMLQSLQLESKKNEKKFKKEQRKLQRERFKQMNKLTSEEYSIFLIGKELSEQPYTKELGLNLEDCVKLACILSDKQY